MRGLVWRAKPVVVAATILGLAISGSFGLGLVSAPNAAADPGPVVQRTVTGANPGVTADALPTVQIDGVVWDQKIVGDTVYAGGEFQNARPAGAAPGTNQTPRANLLAYNIRTGNLITTFNPGLNAQAKVLALSPDGSRLYVGGSFTTAGGATRYRLAAFNTATGALVTSFAPVLNASVSAIAVSDTAVYIGGNFSKVGAVSRTRLAALSPTNGAVLAWAPTADSGINALLMTPDKSRLLAAGSFGTINGATATGLASMDPVTGALYPWAANTVVRNYGTSAAMLSLTTDGTTVYSTGYWFGGTGNFEGVLAADPNSGAIKWLGDCHGDTYGAVPVNGVVYAVSHYHYCSSVGGFPDTNPRSIWYRSNAFTAETTGTVAHNGQGGYYDFYGYGAPSVVNWFPTMDAGTYTGQSQAGWTITGNSEYVIEGGEFPAVNGVKQQGLVRFAVPSLAPKLQGPRVAGAPFNPSLLAVSNKAVRVKWQANYDRDDQTLSYSVIRSDTATPLYTANQTNQFWNRPTMSFTDNTVVAGQTYRYKVSATDPDGNKVQSENVSITVPATVNPYVTQVIADGASDYWRMNGAGPYPDYAGSSDLTATSTTANASGALSGDSDGAADFNGSTSAAATTAAVPGPNTFTAEAWFKTTTTSGGKILGFGNASSGNSSGYDRHIFMENSGRLTFGVYNNNASTVRSAATYNDGQWHLAAAQMSSAGMVMYVDGIKVGTNAPVTTGQDYSGFWRVGADNLNGWPNQPSSSSFSGTIDEVAIYPSALSAAQLRDHYTKSGRTVDLPAAPSDSYGKAVYDDEPSLYLRLDDTSGPTAVDTSANRTSGVYSGGVTYSTPSTVSGSTGTAVTFDGSNGTVASGTQSTGPSTYSEELWFKTTTTGGGKLIGFGDAQSGQSSNYDRHVYMDNEGKVTFGVWTGQANTITSANAYNNGQWHQVVATQSSAGMKLYLDSVLVGTNPQTQAQPYTGYWRIGGDSSWAANNFFTGTIDEASVYSTALTAAQVQAHYNASPAAANTAPVAAFTSACTDGGCSFDGSGSADPDGSIASYAWDFGDTGSSAEISPTHGYTTSGTYTVTLVVTDNKGVTNTVQHDVTVTVPVVNQLPTAAFTSSCTELVCAFDGSTSSDPDGSIASYAWDFGDGATSTVATPSHTFAADDTYAVKLTVTDNRGGTGQVTKNIVVKANAKPTAAFTNSCTGLVCSFNGSTSSDPDGTIASYAWDFGDGATSTDATPSHTFAADDTYSVKLTVTDNGGATGTVTKSVTVAAAVNQKPTAAFTSSTSALTASFDAATSTDTDGTISSYAWDFGDSSTAGSGKTTSHPYASAGTYSVKLTVTDNGGATDTVTKSVTVAAAVNQPPVAAFTSSTSALTASFDAATSSDPDGSISSYAWSYGDGSTGTGQSPSHTYAGTGNYSVTLTVTDNGGATKALTKKVVVAPGVVAADSFDRTVTRWGSADTGGAWTLSSSTPYSTNGSTGNVKLASAGLGVTASLNSVSQQNANVVGDFTINTAATGAGTYNALLTRRVGTSDYRATFQELPGGALKLSITRTVNGTATVLKAVNVSGVTYQANDVLRMRFQVTGSGTTTMSAKVWKAGTPEPAALVTATDTTAALQAPGALAVYTYLSGSSTAVPVTVGLDNLFLTSS